MKKAILSIAILLFGVAVSARQTTAAHAQLTETSIVKDTVGTVYPYAVWKQLMVTGRYIVKPETASDPNTHFIIIRLSDEQFEKKMAAMPKPRESSFFKTGAKFSYFKTTDIDGNKLSSKNLAGKILVLNYWFINCPPCRAEIPELNKLVDLYKNDSNVVFIAVALDEKSNLKNFLRTMPFKYTIVDDGRFIADEYRIQAYPTNVVIDPDGKVYFHSTGFSINMMHWLDKSIKEIKEAQKKETAAR